jgi:hypothetical protein
LKRSAARPAINGKVECDADSQPGKRAGNRAFDRGRFIRKLPAALATNLGVLSVEYQCERRCRADKQHASRYDSMHRSVTAHLSTTIDRN